MIKDTKYYESLDKRSKEWNTYAKFNKVGRYAPKAFTEEQLQESTFKHTFCVDLNQTRKILRPLTKEHYEAYKEYKEKRTLDVWGVESIDLLVRTYAHVFAIQYSKTDLTKESKGSFKRLSKMSQELDVVFDAYNNKNKS